MARHQDLTVASGLHPAHSYEYADATARGAASGFVAGDVGKLALQLSDFSLWVLSDDSPVTWVAVGNASAYAPGGTDVAVADGGTGASSASAARTNLGLVIGTDVEAHDADLTAIAGLSPSNDDIMQRKAGAWTNRTPAQVKTDLAIAAGDVSGLAESVRDTIGTALVAGTNVTITVDDPGDTITIAATGGGGGSALTVEEVDGSPTDSAVTKIVFPNGTLGIASHVATYTPAAGAGGAAVQTSAPSSPATGAIWLDTDATPSAGGGSLVVVDEVVLAADQTDVRFPASGSLPTGYSAWRLLIAGRGSAAATTVSVDFQINGDTGANYNFGVSIGGDSTADAASTAQTAGRLGTLPANSATAGRAGLVEAVFADPENTTYQKAVRSQSAMDNGTFHLTYEHGSLWMSTAAITSITVKAALKAGTRLTLAGVKALGSPRTT